MPLPIETARFFYGTAWKEDRTADLTFEALKAGFVAIDTANQRKHYFEEGVGAGLQKFLALKSKTRDDLFLQTKFTYVRGQDHRLPYNEFDSFTNQVADSFRSTLTHLKTDFIDSYVLHGPYNAKGIGTEDLETWAAMEKLVQAKKVLHLGVSNVTTAQLSDLISKVTIKPSFVQNRCYARQTWDKQVRMICKQHQIRYQGFSLLTANRLELSLPLISALAEKYDKNIPQIIFRFSQQVGMIPLTGTTNSLHMKLDLDIQGFELTEEEVTQIEMIAF